MWRRQDEPKASPSPQSVVVTPPSPVAAPIARPQVVEPVVPKASISLISKGICIKGQVSGSEDIQLDGEINGSVRMAGSRVLIGQDGRITGDIEAREIVVRGALKGNLLASERILVGHTGRWKGNSISPRLVIEEGAVVSGNLEVAESAPKKPEQPKVTVSTPTAAKPVAATPVVASPVAASPVAASNGNGNSASSTNGSSGSSANHEQEVTVHAGGTDSIV